MVSMCQESTTLTRFVTLMRDCKMPGNIMFGCVVLVCPVAHVKFKMTMKETVPIQKNLHVEPNTWGILAEEFNSRVSCLSALFVEPCAEQPAYNCRLLCPEGDVISHQSSFATWHCAPCCCCARIDTFGSVWGHWSYFESSHPTRLQAAHRAVPNREYA